MLYSQAEVKVSPRAMARGISAARWPARLQLLSPGPLTALAPGRKVWLDGGHNPDAGAVIARHFAQERPLHLIIGMLANKDPAAIVAPLAGRLASLTVVPIPGHEAHPAQAFAGEAGLPVRAADDLASALRGLDGAGDVLIAGSLYLAGDVLRLNDEVPE
jgi:dihydrofolate synthase/folylpolyglutamate synthase